MIRIATLNANNLFSRWSFSAEVSRTVAATALPALQAAEQPSGDDVVRIVLPSGAELTGILRTFAGGLVSGKDPKARAWIARRIAVLNADVLCLQEIEDQETLDTFCRDDLAAAGVNYPYRVVIEGNDPRRIDVAICSKLPIARTSSWRYWSDPDGRVFSRDLLQAEVLVPDGPPMHVFVNHLKSNFITNEFRLTPAEIEAEKQVILQRRTRQADAITAILRRLRRSSRVVVLGDLNDDPDGLALAALSEAGLTEHVQKATTIPGPSRTGALIGDKFAAESGTMWTHRHRAGGVSTYACFDQIWTTPDVPVTAAHVMRRTQITGDGTDHDPACIDVAI